MSQIPKIVVSVQLICSKKAVLIEASEVFAAMFRFHEQQNHKTGIIELKEDKLEPFKMLLTYIHTGYLSGLNLSNFYDFFYAGENKRTKCC